MKVYLTPPQPSRGLQRIADALTRYAPPQVTITTFHDEADLVVIYAIGRRERIAGQTRHLLEKGRKYAVIQVCLRSTMSPFTKDWFEVWRGAELVWSYYDLQRAINIDVTHGRPYLKLGNFLHAPLGVDSSVFYPRDRPRFYYIVGTSGLSRLQESVRECMIAAETCDRRVFHLGRQVTGKDFVDCAEGLTDDQLAHRYSGCEFVSGLRRKEGFELPAAEGLLCGARPILFDTPDYRWNYKEWAEYIHEGTRQEVVDQLVQLFKQGARPVIEAERQEAATWFNWERVCGEFWRRCLP